MTEVVDNRMINPFKCNEQKLMNISTGYKAESADLVAAKETCSEKVTPVKLDTFATKSKKPLSIAHKVKKVYE